MFINLPCPGKLCISAMKAHLNHSTSFQGAISSGRNKNTIRQKFEPERSQGKGETRSPDGFTALLPSGRLRQCDLRSCLQAEKKKRRAEAARQGTPGSFHRIRRLCDYRLPTTNASCWLERSWTDRHRLIVCFLITHSFLCLSLSNASLN